jgi:hypothetical protein
MMASSTAKPYSWSQSLNMEQHTVASQNTEIRSAKSTNADQTVRNDHNHLNNKDESFASTPISSDRNHIPATGSTMLDERQHYVTCIMEGPSLRLTHTTV